MSRELQGRSLEIARPFGLLRAIMKLFRLYVKIGKKWEMVCSVQATDRETAKREAILLLKPEDRKKPLRLEEEGEPAAT